MRLIKLIGNINGYKYDFMCDAYQMNRDDFEVQNSLEYSTFNTEGYAIPFLSGKMQPQVMTFTAYDFSHTNNTFIDMVRGMREPFEIEVHLNRNNVDHIYKFMAMFIGDKIQNIGTKVVEAWKIEFSVLRLTNFFKTERLIDYVADYENGQYTYTYPIKYRSGIVQTTNGFTLEAPLYRNKAYISFTAGVWNTNSFVAAVKPSEVAGMLSQTQVYNHLFSGVTAQATHPGTKTYVYSSLPYDQKALIVTNNGSVADHNMVYHNRFLNDLAGISAPTQKPILPTFLTITKENNQLVFWGLSYIKCDIHYEYDNLELSDLSF